MGRLLSLRHGWRRCSWSRRSARRSAGGWAAAQQERKNPPPLARGGGGCVFPRFPVLDRCRAFFTHRRELRVGGSPPAAKESRMLADIARQLRDLRIEHRPLAALLPYARNPRTHSRAQIAQLARSIREFGWTNPVLVDGANGIIAGHGRVLAARELGLVEVPVIELAHLTRRAEAGLCHRRQSDRPARRLGRGAAGARVGRAQVNRLRPGADRLLAAGARYLAGRPGARRPGRRRCGARAPGRAPHPPG